MTKKTDNSGKNQGKVGRGKPPKEYQFKPGQSGNPKGKPLGTISVVAALKRKLEEIKKDTSNKAKRTYLELLIETIFEKALSDKDVVMIRDIINRIDGMPTQKMEQSGSLEFQFDPKKKKLIDKIMDED